MSEAVPAPERLLARLARRPAFVLLVLCAVLWLPGIFTLPPLDRDESRFAEASKQMLETGDFVDIRFGAGTRYNKPVGIYWLQAAATKILGDQGHDQIWTYRIPSWIAGYLALLLMFTCARAFKPPETALVGAALLGVSVATIAETQIATTDAALLAAILGAQAVLLRIYLAARGDAHNEPSRWMIVAGWFAFACGVLLKGPVIAGVLGVTVLALSFWDRDWRWLRRTRPLDGLVILALVVLPWAIAIAVHSQGAFYRQALGHDFADKLMSGQESHGAPPGYYLALSSLTLWPAVLFVLPALSLAWRERSVPGTRYLLAWAASAWVMFELVPTKLPHYILPAYPPLIILAACWILESPRPRVSTGARVLMSLSAAQFLIGLAAFAAVTILAPQRFGSGTTGGLVVAASIGAAIGLGGLFWYARSERTRAFYAACIASAVLVPVLVVGVAPRLAPLWLSPRLAALVTNDRRPDDPSPVVAGYAEPSLIFLLGSNTHIDTGADAARIAARQGGLALIEDHDRNAFLAGLDALDTQAFPLDGLSGFDYSRGRKMHITIYRVIPAAPLGLGE